MAKVTLCSPKWEENGILLLRGLCVDILGGS